MTRRQFTATSNAHAKVKAGVARLGGPNGRRRSNLSPYSQRLTPAEVAQIWFRRGAQFANQIWKTYPDFPEPGPDGLLSLSRIREWFDRFEGRKQPFSSATEEEEEIMRLIHA